MGSAVVSSEFWSTLEDVFCFYICNIDIGSLCHFYILFVATIWKEAKIKKRQPKLLQVLL